MHVIEINGIILGIFCKVSTANTKKLLKIYFEQLAYFLKYYVVADWIVQEIINGIYSLIFLGSQFNLAQVNTDNYYVVFLK